MKFVAEKKLGNMGNYKKEGRRKPDFVCVGPEKTGTSWLYKMLGRHPGVWLPPVKELRFLNEGHLFPEHSLTNVLLNSHWHYRALRRTLAVNIVRQFCTENIVSAKKYRQFSWILTYCLGSRSFAWYSKLFPGDGGMLAGDISPMYYGIPESRIKELSEHNPKTHILIFIRNPIDRVWSKALMNLCVHRKRHFQEVSHEEFIAFFDEVFEPWTPYIETAALWKRYFPNVFVGFYDLLKEDASRLFEDICAFLGIDPTVVITSIGERVNKGIGKKIPEALYSHLRGQYREEIRLMAESDLGKYPRQWLDAL